MLMIIYNLITILQNAITAMASNISNITTNIGTMITQLQNVLIYTANSFDPTKWTEHEAVITGVNSSTLTTLMSVTGKGMLESTLLVGNPTIFNNYGISASTLASVSTMPEIVVTIDGSVVLDLTCATATSVYSPILGIVKTSSIKPCYNNSNSAISMISGFEHIFGGLLYTVSPLFPIISFPSPTQQIMGSGTSIVVLDEPLYFKSSLLIQVKSVANAGAVKAVAKARY